MSCVFTSDSNGLSLFPRVGYCDCVRLHVSTFVQSTHQVDRVHPYCKCFNTLNRLYRVTIDKLCDALLPWELGINNPYVVTHSACTQCVWFEVIR